MPADSGSVQGPHFDHEVAILCVRWYVTYKLRSRNLVSMMGERGIELGANEREPAFRDELLREAIRMLLSGDLDAGKSLRGLHY